jgi:fucose permease
MVIYLPLLLHNKIGFEWREIGLILIIMILPFLIFEYPVGRMIDNKTGEKEFLFIGFIIMAAASFTIPFIGQKIFWLWAMLLFISRIGASLVEISAESYFFKKVNDRHSSIISLFRMTQPLAYIAAPLIAIPALLFTTIPNLFAILGIVCLAGLLFLPKIDTR